MLATALAVLTSACAQPVEEGSVHDDWCERAEAAMVAFVDYAPRLEQDLGALSEEELLDFERAMEGWSADPVPDPIREPIGVMRGDTDLPDDPLLAEEEFFDAVRTVSAYAEDECGVEFDEDPVG